jgi:hypothetical protein
MATSDAALGIFANCADFVGTDRQHTFVTCDECDDRMTAADEAHWASHTDGSICDDC